tara:strand:+ start:675 stop:1445 length:771 start_codon:yes stop_codon:yes gene_type:complete
MSKNSIEFEKLIDVLDKLLAPDGCDWDREQTHESLIPYLLEETHEVIEAIENRNMSDLKEELGDLMLHILFQAKLSEKDGHFNISDSLKNISSKLIRRHPHIFSNNLDDSYKKGNWESTKKKEKGRKSVLEGVPISLPSLTKAQRIQEKASSVGFDWKDLPPIWNKINEEILELEEVLQSNNSDRIKDELGDVLFSIVNLSRFLSIDAESALRHTIKKFENRFKKVENQLELEGIDIQEATLDEMDEIWNDIKKQK